MSFVNLHKHSQWSLLDGAGNGDQYANLAAEKGQHALALTDHGTVAGMLEHFQACTKAGIVPIPGCEVYFRTNRLDHTPRKVPGKKQPNKMVSVAPQRWHLTLLAMNGIGWKNLQAIVSESYDSGLYYKPTVDFELLTRYSEGIYCLLGCIGGQFSHHIQSGGMYLPQYISTMQSIFKDRISAEIMPHDFDGQRQLNIDTINVCNDYSIPIVATGDTHYPTIEWAKTQDVLLMLSTRQSHNKREKAEDAGEDIYTMHQDNPTLWLMSADEIALAFAQFHPLLPANVVDAAIDHSGVIIEQFDPIYFDRDTKMPFIGHEIIDKIDPGELHDPAIDADQVVLDTLTRWCSEGLKEIQEIYPPEHWQKFPLAIYEQRISRELDVLQKVGMHAVRYMLMVAGECRWARKNDVVIGPGRGSAAGSLVAYLSGITDIDPIPYKLKFERFINENRKGMPDIDIDFMPGAEGRDKVKGHTADVYGHENVIDIAAYGTYGPRSAIESVCRVFDDVIDYQEAMRYKNAIDLKPTDKADLEECAERFDEIATFKNVYPEIWDIACRIEGHPYSQSVHASGVLVKPSSAEMPTAAKIDKKTGARLAITAWPDTRELLAGYGWLKIDYLVIEGLVRQHQIMKAMRERENTPIDLRRLAVRWDPEAVDPEVMQSFADGRTLGVWQFEGKGTIPVLKAVKPTNMHDIAAVNALIRPGARDSVNEYAERKNGITPESEWYWHDSFEPILKSTYGLLVYQEQVMEIVQEIAGFTPSEADDLRKAMGKKYREGLAAVVKFLDQLGYGPKWMNGATPTIGEQLADQVWQAIIRRGEYSFNASHAYAYGLISYHDALFKHLMPADFYSWLLSGTDGKDLPKKLSATMREGAKVNLSITPPDINHSLMNFKVLDKQTILYGLESVKGVGPTGVTAIFEHRPYTSYQDFCDRVPARAVNKNAKLALVGSGAFDAFNLRQFMTEQEKASNEIAYIGIKISGISDLVKYGPLIEATIHTEDDFNEAEDGQNLCVGGEITGVKKTMTKKKGESMAFVNLAYGTDEYRVTVFPPVWRLFQNILIEGNVVFFEGTVDISEQYGRGFIGQQCVTLEELVSLDSKRDGVPVT